MTYRLTFAVHALLAAILAIPLVSHAQEDQIRKNLAARVPNLSNIDEISKTPIPGLYELRLGTDVIYADAKGDYIIQGQLMDTKARKNLTEERINKLTAIDFNALDISNAITFVRGNGKRKLAVFEDPNCVYCKRFEKDLDKVDDITVYVFLIPILGQDSVTKSKQIWCSADRAKAWTSWMSDNVAPEGDGACDTSALDTNLAFARKHRITGTPTLIFADGTRVTGAINAKQIESKLK